MGGLRTADVGVAVVGTTDISETEKKQAELKEEQKKFQKRMDNLKSDPTIPLGKKIEMMKALATEQRNQFGNGGMFGLLQ